jgi:hypothetical protein
MSFFFPKAALSLRAVFEDFTGKSDASKAPDYTFVVRPKKLSVSINDYTQADTFSAEIDYKQFPFDPRCLRALEVTIHMENSREDITPKQANTLFVGFADEESIEFDDTTRTVKFEGRDFTALLLDAPYPAGNLSFATPVETLIGQLVKNLKATQRLTVENRTGETLPTLSQFAPDFDPMGGGGKNAKKDENYWEVIQDIVSRAGLIAYIELDRLVITRPRALYNSDKAIQFIYGKNLKRLEFKRKLGRQKGFNIRVRSLPTGEKKPIDVKIPEEATDAWCTSIGLIKKRVTIPKFAHDKTKTEEDAPFLTFPIPNIKSKEHLTKVGEGIYEEVSRQQLEGTFETHDMNQIQTDSNDNQKSYDFLKIRNATPVAIDVDNSDMQKMRRISTYDDRVSYLVDQGYPKNVASAIATAYGKTDMTFYTSSVEFSYDNANGMSIKLNFINYISPSNRTFSK